jgi:hypothetical protein
MKNVYEVLRQKEQELVTLQKHVEALRVVAPLLHEEVPTVAATVSISSVPTPCAQHRTCSEFSARTDERARFGMGFDC